MSLKIQPQKINKKIKRVFDISFTLFALIYLVPLFIVIAIIIKITNHGPILKKVRRIGLNEKEFNLYKFRTMYVFASEVEIKKVSKLNHDFRITKVGRFLRKTSIDELPCFFNVLKGDMSIVGPRPSIPLHVKHLSELERKRFSIKPGITGWAQVNGFRTGNYEKAIENDLFYVENSSFIMDLKIIFYTIFTATHGRNAY